MIRKSPDDGNQLLYRLMPLEAFFHGVALGVFAFYFLDQVGQNGFYSLAWIIGGINVGKLAYVFKVKYLTADDSEESREKTIKILIYSNIASGIFWSTAFVYFDYVIPRFSIGEPLVLLIVSSLIMISVAGSALWSKLFMAFAAPALAIPISYLVYHQKFEHIGVWAFLTIVAIMLFWICLRIEKAFESSRQIVRQHSLLLQEVALSKEQATRYTQELEQTHDSLTVEIIERKSAEEKIRASEKETARILQDMQETYFRVDATGKIIRLSSSAQYLTGYTLEELIGKHFSCLFAQRSHYKEFVAQLNEFCGVLENFESLFAHSIGHDFWVSFNAHYSGNESGKQGFEGTVRDITETKRAAEALFSEKERLHVTLESIGDGVITTNIKGIVDYLNPTAEIMTGWSTKDAENIPLSTVLNLVSEGTDKAVVLPLKTWLKQGNRAQLPDPAVMTNKMTNKQYAIELGGAPLKDFNGNVTGSVLVFHNVTKLRTLAKQLSYQASHDALTGLINRLEFENRVKQAIQSAKNENKQHVLCYVDLDQFKIVNDTSGHHAGDELLKQITAKIQSTLRASDTLARLGGDEFGILYVGCPMENAEVMSETIRSEVEKFHFVWDEHIFRVGTSIGLVKIDKNTESLTELFSSADSACYIAKDNGRNQVQVYKHDDNAVTQRQGQMQWMQRLQQALEDGNFELHFQRIAPVPPHTANRLSGELLLRMVDTAPNNVGNLIHPQAFIPAAERYQLMAQIDRWVVTNAMYALAQGKNLENQWGMCAINLSGQSLGDEKLLDIILQLLKETNIPPSILCFEITESAVIANIDNATEFMQTLRQLGVRFALDDFGSGLSSFTYLKNLPVDFLKLDGELVMDISKDKRSFSMVEAVHKVAHVMGMQTIAEHVHDEATLKALSSISVDWAQGFGIEKPRPFAISKGRQKFAS